MVTVTKRELWTRDDRGTLTLNLHSGQARAWLSAKRFIWMLAGTQGGKTSFEPLWLWREIQEQGSGDYLAVTATYPLLKLKMLPEFLRVFGETFDLGEYYASDRVFQFRDGGTRIIFGSATNPESLESATAKAAVLDECGQDQFRLEAWRAIQRRLSLHQGRVLGGTTLYNLGWLKTEAYDPWRDGDPDHEIIQFDSLENPAFPREEYERARRTMPDWKFDLFYRGRYARPAGLIYGDYVDSPRDLGGHLVEDFPIPDAWPRHVGIDFGGANTALIWLARDPETDVYYLYRESLNGDRSTAEHVAQAKADAEGSTVKTWYGGSSSETQPRMDWRRAGIMVQGPMIRDVESGIDRVVALFKTRRLFVFRSCRGVRSELGTYSRKVFDDGAVDETIQDKQRFHRLDALRYCAQPIGASRYQVL